MLKSGPVQLVLVIVAVWLAVAFYAWAEDHGTTGGRDNGTCIGTQNPC